MDYAREELLRQRRALAGLLSARSADSPREETEAPRPLGGGELPPREEPRLRSSAAGAGTQTPWRRSASWGTGAPREAQAADGMAAETAKLRPAGKEAPETRRRRESEIKRRQSAGRRAFGAGTGVPSERFYAAGPAAASAVSPDRGAAGERGAEIQAVSRAIQRDARRYDGGFTIY